MKFDLARIKRRLRYWLQRDRREDLLREEMQFHVESLAADLTAQGIATAEARGAAQRQFGNLTLKAEESRATWISRWMSDSAQDLRYTIRGLRRDAGFTTFAILIVGLGIGASSTVFSVVNTLLVRPLPFHEPDRLVWIANGGKEGNLSGQTIQVSHMLDLREFNKSFSGIAAYFAFSSVADSKLTGTGEPERLSGVPVSENFFPLLGVSPQIGRHFTPDECKWNGPKAVLLSDGLWRRRFASDPSIAGQKLTINDAPVTVAGVLPASFDFASVFSPGGRVDLFYPFPLTKETDRWGNTLSVVGRLKPGITVESAQLEFSALAIQLEKQHRDRNFLLPKLSALAQHVNARFRPALFLLACAVGVVMLIVCANLSNLQLARVAARQKEMAIRVSLGAGRYRLIRQLLTESVFLSSAGAALGLLLAYQGTKILAHLDTMGIPLLDRVRIDITALGFTLLAAILTGIIFGIAPALQVPALALHGALKDSSRGSSAGKSHSWIRSGLVVSEFAFACVLLVGSGLLIRSFLRVLDVNLGFQPERAVAMRIDPTASRSTQEQRNAYFDEALRRTRDITGVESAGLTDVLPLGVNRSWGVGAKGQVYSREHPNPDSFVRIVSDGYLPAMGIPLRAGRDLAASDTPSSKRVIVINETLARTLWPGQNAIGQIMRVDGDREVVGIAGDVRHVALEQGSGAEMYIPIRQTRDYSSVDLVIRTALPPASIASAVRSALRPIEPNLPANQIRTLQQLVDKAVSPRRFVVVLLGGFAAFALILASLGIYGVISYSVNQRTQEIGIRMALGASDRDLQTRIVLQTLGLASIGMLIGVAASWLLARTVSSMLFGITATDPLTFAAMLAILTAVAALAGYLPGRRASRIDPISALRAD